MVNDWLWWALKEKQRLEMKKTVLHLLQVPHWNSNVFMPSFLVPRYPHITPPTTSHSFTTAIHPDCFHLIPTPPFAHSPFCALKPYTVNWEQPTPDPGTQQELTWGTSLETPALHCLHSILQALAHLLPISSSWLAFLLIHNPRFHSTLHPHASPSQRTNSQLWHNVCQTLMEISLLNIAKNNCYMVVDFTSGYI